MKILTVFVLASFTLLSSCNQTSGIANTHEEITSESAKKESAAHPVELAKAFVAAFGRPAPVSYEQGDEILNFSPEALFELSPNLWVLISDGTFEGGHSSNGQLSVHYLTREKGDYKLLGKWMNMGGGANFGQVATWKIRRDIEDNPVIWTTSGYSGMGCTVESHDLISLLPNAARLSAKNLITMSSYDADQSDKTQKSWKTEGELMPLDDKKSFNIVYKGKVNATVHYQFTLESYFTMDQGIIDSLIC